MREIISRGEIPGPRAALFRGCFLARRSVFGREVTRAIQRLSNLRFESHQKPLGHLRVTSGSLAKKQGPQTGSPNRVS